MKIITMKKLVLLLLTFITLGYKSQTTLEGDKIIGLWEVGSGKARIKVTKYGDKYGGKIVWLRDPLDEKGEKKVDKNNPEETK
jgi:predicted type IV restriction endonuclease